MVHVSWTVSEQLNGSNICVTFCATIRSTSMWTPEFLWCRHNLVVLSHAHRRVVIEHEVAIGVVIHCFEREVVFFFWLLGLYVHLTECIWVTSCIKWESLLPVIDIACIQ